MTSASEPTFFIDWCLGKSVAQALMAAGAQVVHHGQHFPQDTPDIEWLEEVSHRGWLVLTKDQRIARNSVELRVVAQARARVFMLASGKLKSDEMAQIFVRKLEYMTKFSQSHRAPFIVRLYKSGKAASYKSHTDLLKLLKPY